MNIRDLSWSSDARIARLDPFFPKSKGKPRVDDRPVSNGTIGMDRNGLSRRGRLIGGTRSGTNTKLHATCDSQGRPLNFFVTAGQVSDDIGPRALLSSLPDVDWLIAGRCYDADRFRKDLKDRGVRACIPGRKQRKTPV